MTKYLQMDGVDDILTYTTSTNVNRIVMEMSIEHSGGMDYYAVSEWMDIGLIRSSGVDQNPSGNTIYDMYLDDVKQVINTSFVPTNKRVKLEIGFGSYTGMVIYFLSSQFGYSKGKIWDIKLYSATTLVAHYDMSTGAVQDVSGNGNNAILTGGTFVEDSIVTDGLVGYWHYTQGISGDTWSNIAPNSSGYHMILNGTGSHAIDGIKGMHFDGVDDYAMPTEKFTSSTFTFESWVTFNSLNSISTVFGANSGATNSSLSYDNANQSFSFWGDTISISSLSDATVGTLYHLVGVSDGMKIELFVNGVSQGSLNRVHSLTNTSLIMGAYIAPDFNDMTFNYFNGYIASVRLYNKALTSMEVSQNYSVGNAIGLGETTQTGASYTLTLFDTMTLSDMIAKRLGEKRLNDSISLSDSIAKRVAGKRLNDTVTLSDSKSMQAFKKMSDTITLIDNTINITIIHPPSVIIVSVDHSKISRQTGINQTAIKFTFDYDVTAWMVNVMGVSWDTGVVADSGGVVSAGTEITAVIDWTELYQEGQNRVNIYGQNSMGWTPYDGVVEEPHPIIVTDGLVGYWHYASGISENTWNNISPNTIGQYNGVINGATLQSDSVRFTKISKDYVSIPMGSISYTAFTYEVLVKVDSAPTDNSVINHYQNNNNRTYNHISSSDSGTALWGSGISNTAHHGTNSNIVSNQFLHVVHGYDGNRLYLFVNGIKANYGVSSFNVGAITPTTIYIGANWFNNIWNNGTDGNVVYAHVYNRFLTISEISQNYQSGTSVGL